RSSRGGATTASWRSGSRTPTGRARRAASSSNSTPMAAPAVSPSGTWSGPTPRDPTAVAGADAEAGSAGDAAPRLDGLPQQLRLREEGLQVGDRRRVAEVGVLGVAGEDEARHPPVKGDERPAGVAGLHVGGEGRDLAHGVALAVDVGDALVRDREHARRRRGERAAVRV